jgi:hypothetical protein
MIIVQSSGIKTEKDTVVSLEAETGGSELEAILSKKKVKESLLSNILSMVICPCNPCYPEGLHRRIVVPS